MTKLFLFAVCHYMVFVAYTLSVILVYCVEIGSRPSHFQCCCMLLCVGCALGANAYWSTAFHIYTPLPFRPGRGFGDLFRTHFFVNAGNLNTVKFGKLWSDMVDYAQLQLDCNCSALPSNRRHLSNGDRLEDKREDYQNCSVLFIYDSCTQWHTSSESWLLV